MSDILRLSVPLTLWLALFSLVYGLHGATCALGETPITGRVVMVAVWIAGVGLQAAMLFALRHPRFIARSPTIRRASLALSTTALFASVWSLFPVLVLPLC